MNETTHAPDVGVIANQYGLTFTVGAHSARHLRRILRTYLRLWEMEELADAAELALTELIANVVRHVPDRRCSVLVLRQPDGLRVEVTDGSDRLPAPTVRGRFAEEGRGLTLLAAVVDRWGVEQVTGGGKRVWFECTGT